MKKIVQIGFCSGKVIGIEMEAEQVPAFVKGLKALGERSKPGELVDLADLRQDKPGDLILIQPFNIECIITGEKRQIAVPPGPLRLY